MPIKVYRPVTKGRRFSSVQDFSDITRNEPEKSLIIMRKEQAGRTNGKITVRHRGGGTRRFIRVVDTKRLRFDIPATVTSVEYDPNRGGRIGLLTYKDGVKAYMLLPDGVKVGERLVSSLTEAEIKPGNRLPLEKIPVGAFIHAVELAPMQGAKLGRGAGTSLQLMAIEGTWATIKLPSGEVRRVPKNCLATIGTVSNPDWHLVRWGKAGRMRLRGIKPTVRGKVMNPVDHPHGGGEGKHPIGMKYAKTKWGKHALGVKTRRRHLSSNQHIVSRRNGNLMSR